MAFNLEEEKCSFLGTVRVVLDEHLYQRNILRAFVSIKQALPLWEYRPQRVGELWVHDDSILGEESFIHLTTIGRPKIRKTS